VKNAGFLRTLMMPRFMEVLLKTKWYERELFFNTAIAAEDLITLNEFKILDQSSEKCNFVLIGHENRCKILNYLIKKYHNLENEIKCLYKKDEVSKLSIEGAIAIAKKAGYLK